MPATSIDDATAAYIVVTRASFEDLRQVAAQVAGVLVLASSGSNAAAHRPMLAAAKQLYEEGIDGLRCARVTARTRPHHHRLMAAAAAIGEALESALRGPTPSRTDDIDAVLEPLRAGYAQLQLASRELPGFDLVTFDRACCSLVRISSE